MDEPIWQAHPGEGPLVAAALHAGHDVRDEVAALLALAADERRREEDPYTDEWTAVGHIRVVGVRSRFEVDLNRPREKAVYRTAEDAWGLRVWKDGGLPDAVAERSLAGYDAFYAAMHELFSGVERRHGRFVVYDLHSYNHRRAGPGGPPADEAGNPQVNVGTGSLDRLRWGPVVDRFMTDLCRHPFPGGPLDVRENVRFQGGHFSRWVHRNFADTGCVLAVEFKKFFMDEWTGEPDRALIGAIGEGLKATVPGVLQELQRL